MVTTPMYFVRPPKLDTMLQFDLQESIVIGRTINELIQDLGEEGHNGAHILYGSNVRSSVIAWNIAKEFRRNDLYSPVVPLVTNSVFDVADNPDQNPLLIVGDYETQNVRGVIPEFNANEMMHHVMELMSMCNGHWYKVPASDLQNARGAENEA